MAWIVLVDGSLLDALHCAIKKLGRDTKQNNSTELSHRVFQLGRSCTACDFHGPGRMMTNYAPIEDYKITSLLLHSIMFCVKTVKF